MTAEVDTGLGLHVPELACSPPFDLRLALHGHGWVSLEPHRFEADSGVFTTCLWTSKGAVFVSVRGASGGLSYQTSKKGAKVEQEVGAQLSRMLRLDEDFSSFWALCRSEPRLRWVARRGAGRLLRSPTLFEDLMKLLFTTNCSWAATQRMTERLVGALGSEVAPGRRAFPLAEACAEMDERFFREEVRAGYRARHAVVLSRAFAEGRLSARELEDPSVSTDALRRRLLALPGFGPYAVGQALRLLGRYDDLALDSWCRSKLAELEGRRRPRSDRAIERSYQRFGTYRGLVLWMDLTRDWHLDRRRRKPSA